jgi:hypothetical protein
MHAGSIPSSTFHCSQSFHHHQPHSCWNGSLKQRPCAATGPVRVFRQNFTLEDAIGSHACSLEANMRVTNGIPFGSSLLLPVGTVNCVQTPKAPEALRSTRLPLMCLMTVIMLHRCSACKHSVRLLRLELELLFSVQTFGTFRILPESKRYMIFA